MKTKKLLPLALLPLGIIPLITISCSTQPDNLYSFEAEGLKIYSDGEITGFASKNTHVGPLEIKEEYNGVVITSIASHAFQDEQIEGLILPKTLTRINQGAFMNIKSPVKKTESISTPWDLSHLTNLEYIGNVAFEMKRDETRNLNINLNLSGLTKLTEIGFSSFANLGLTSVNLKGVNNLKNISYNAFNNNKLISIDLEDCENLETIGDRAFEFNKIKKILWPINNSKIKSIGGSAFSSNQLTNLVLNPLINLESIGEWAFWKNKISSIIWPTNSKINNIDEYAFRANVIVGELDLTNLTNLTSIGLDAFKSNQISSIIWPTNSKINSIGLEAFARNNFGANIPQFPPGLTTANNGGISPEQIFTNKVRKIPSTN